MIHKGHLAVYIKKCFQTVVDLDIKHVKADSMAIGFFMICITDCTV